MLNGDEVSKILAESPSARELAKIMRDQRMRVVFASPVNKVAASVPQGKTHKWSNPYTESVLFPGRFVLMSATEPARVILSKQEMTVLRKLVRYCLMNMKHHAPTLYGGLTQKQVKVARKIAEDLGVKLRRR